jgi:hypothetical protein
MNKEAGEVPSLIRHPHYSILHPLPPFKFHDSWPSLTTKLSRWSPRSQVMAGLQIVSQSIRCTLLPFAVGASPALRSTGQLFWTKVIITSVSSVPSSASLRNREANQHSVNARVSSQPDLLQFRNFHPRSHDAVEVSQRCGHCATSNADFLK